jgi:hypothetical protein
MGAGETPGVTRESDAFDSESRRIEPARYTLAP